MKLWALHEKLVNFWDTKIIKMEGDAEVNPTVSSVNQQHIKDGVIDLTAGSLGVYH